MTGCDEHTGDNAHAGHVEWFLECDFGDCARFRSGYASYFGLAVTQKE